MRWPFLVYAGAVVALAYSRRRLRLPRPPMVPLVSTVPLAVAAALPRSKLEYGATWVSYVWLFKVAWEIPTTGRRSCVRGCASATRSGSTA